MGVFFLMSIESVICFLQTWPVELTSFALFVVCMVSVLIMGRFWGRAGLYVYSVTAIIASNFQVLKAAEVSYLDDPLALGTVAFSSTYLTSDILTEIFGAKAARTSIFLGFASSILLLCLMILTLGVPPLKNVTGTLHEAFNHAHDALMVVFTPSISILMASLSAYGISQILDITLFAYLKEKKSTLWFRTFTSMGVSAFVDTFLFSFLAWIVFAEKPISWHTLFFTYVLGAYILRLIAAIAQTPILYMAKKWIPTHHDCLVPPSS